MNEKELLSACLLESTKDDFPFMPRYLLYQTNVYMYEYCMIIWPLSHH